MDHKSITFSNFSVIFKVFIGTDSAKHLRLLVQKMKLILSQEVKKYHKILKPKIFNIYSMFLVHPGYTYILKES